MKQSENNQKAASRKKPFVKSLVAVLILAMAAFVLLPITRNGVNAAEPASNPEEIQMVFHNERIRKIKETR